MVFPRWLKIYTDPRALIAGLHGFCSGLPLFLLLGTLAFWLADAQVDIDKIGYFAWAGLAYTVKWMWSPLVDHLPLPIIHRFGRRRSWLLLSQVGVTCSLLWMASYDPAHSEQLPMFAWAAVVLAFCSATQDIVVDAYRIESAPEEKQGVLAATYQLGYRLAKILASAGGLMLAAWFTHFYLGDDVETYNAAAWQNTFRIMAAFMGIGIITLPFIREPQQPTPTADSQFTDIAFIDWLTTTVVTPFTNFFGRYGKLAILILAVVSCYRISDVVMGNMAATFYLHLGYHKEDIAWVSKIFGVIMTLTGAFFGGVLINWAGVMRIMLLGGVLAAATNLLYTVLALYGEPNIPFLIGVISADNLSSGIATAAFIAYLASLTNIAYSATQYAMLSSIMMLIPKTLAGFAGKIVEYTSYATFFTITALIGIPVVVLVWLAGRYATAHQLQKKDSTTDPHH